LGPYVVARPNCCQPRLSPRHPQRKQGRYNLISEYLAKLLGSDDTEAVVRLITALLVLVLDPLAVLLTLAAARRW
jgi:hypothetical protein